MGSLEERLPELSMSSYDLNQRTVYNFRPIGPMDFVKQ